jgi:hypothetical protein
MTAALSHFALHRQKVFTPAEIAEGKNRPWGIEQGLERLSKFFSRQADWTTPADGRLARQVLLYHTGHNSSRAVRDQFLHSCEQVLKILLTSVNTQRGNGPLMFMQVKRTSIMDLVEATGFARSTVIAVLHALTRAGVLRTKRRKTDAERSARRELVATRWITPSLFEMLGLGGWISRQSKKGAEQEPRNTETPGKERTRDKRENSGRVQKIFDALNNSKPPPGRNRTDRGDE